MLKRCNRAVGWPMLFAAWVVCVDQLSKYAAHQYLSLGRSLPMGDYFNLVRVHNTGAAFGVLSGQGNWAVKLLIIVAIFAIIAITIGLCYWPRAQHLGWSARMGLASVLGGALGNLIDRVQYGYVIDFIDLHYRHWHWPVFNVADIAVCLGILTLLLFGHSSRRTTDA